MNKYPEGMYRSLILCFQYSATDSLMLGPGLGGRVMNMNPQQPQRSLAPSRCEHPSASFPSNSLSSIIVCFAIRPVAAAWMERPKQQ